MRVLVFGSTGQVARELARANWASGTEVVCLDRAAADFSRPGSLGALVDAHAPDAVIIAAAYTAVDRAEGEEGLVARINAAAPGVIAAAAARHNIPVLHLSTDYVFDGTKDGPYTESDEVRPLGAYGRTKLAGEERVRAANHRHLILRTSWVYSAHGTNFVRTMLRLAATRAEVGVVVDQRGCPTAAGDIADALARLVPQMLDPAAPSGTYHLAGASETTWHGFAEAIFVELSARGLPRPRNNPIRTSDYPTAARRPLNSRLSSDKIAAEFGVRLPGFEASLPAVLDELLGPAEAKGAA